MLFLFLMIALFALMPIGDDNTGRKTTPYVTYALLAANIAVFVLLQGLGANERFTLGYSVVPTEITRGVDLTSPVAAGANARLAIPQAPGPNPIFLTVLSAMFMHGSLMHLGGNMLYLWIFGDNLEDAMGHFKFLLFYLLCGLLATVAHIFSDANSVIPSLGASGAIAGVLGGYLLMYPSRQVRVLIGYMGIVAMPALVVIGFWGALQFFNGFGSLFQTRGGGGVAYLAHVGGFVAGLVLVKLFASSRSAQVVAQRESQPVDHFPLGGGPRSYQ
jgi:membrane associated rhomboid family serine protease